MTILNSTLAPFRASAIALSLLAFVAVPTSAHAFSSGDWVLGKWQGGDYWYPGVVEKAAGGKVTIKYDDGDREVAPVSAVRHYDWAAGTRVECNWKQQGEWYPGKIASVRGAEVAIHYDDGDKETTHTGNCRQR